MFAKRELYCGICGCKNFAFLDNQKLDLRCSNKECNVRIKSKFDNQNVISNYRYSNGRIINFTNVHCENCSKLLDVKFNDYKEFKIICDCGYSIFIKKTNNDDLKISSKIL